MFNKVFILFKREWYLNKRHFLYLNSLSVLFFSIISYIDVSKNIPNYVFACMIPVSFLFVIPFVISLASIKSEINGVYKTLKSFPVSNVHIFISKTIYLFFFLSVSYLIPINIVLFVYEIPIKLEMFFPKYVYYLYLYGLFIIFFTIGVLNIILSFINSKIVTYLFNFMLFLNIALQYIPSFRNIGDEMIDGNAFGKSEFINGFLSFTIFMLFLLITLIYIGIKVINNRNYRMCGL